MIALILKTTNAGDEWTSLQSGFNNDFYDIYFTSDSVGFIVGGEGIDIYRTGIILYTSNAGQTWIQQCDSISRDLYAISFANEQVGYISGGGPIYPGAGIILKTENAGISWDTVYITNSPYGDNLYDIDFVNQNVGWAVGGSIFDFGVS